MREWIAVSISALTFMVLVAGFVFFLGHVDEKVETLESRMERMEDKVDDVRERVARIEGQLQNGRMASQ